MKEKIQIWVVWHLPKWMIRWALARAFAKASVEKLPDREASTITVFEAAEGW